jgi:hypothetical protein
VTHGHDIEEIGYHCRDYFLKQWDKFKDKPWGVLAHSTHVRGIGAFENGVERCRVKVTVASQVPREVCEKICRRIEWLTPLPDAEIGGFLREFYTAERAFLEREQLFGKPHPDKHYRSATGSGPPAG